MFSESISYPAAFAAGLFSFFSPCILPLIPAYFSFITGYSLEELTDSRRQVARQKVIRSTLAYVGGFSLVFVLMGASVSFLGNLLNQHRDTLRILGGLLIILLGIHLTGIFRITFLDIERRIRIAQKPLHFLGTFLVGMAFGLGWSPCIGPLLGAILVVAGSQETVRQGVLLLGIYSAGLAIPFIILSFFIHLLIGFIKKASRIVRYVNTFAGILLIFIGLLLVTNRLTLLTVSF